MPYMDWAALLNSPQPVASGTTLSASTTLTDVSAAPNFILPANFLQNGSALRLTASGTFVSAASTPGTLKLGFYYGGVAGASLADTGTVITLPNSAASWNWRIEATTTVRSTGTSGTAMTTGVAWLSTAAGAWTSYPLPTATPAAVTIDTTAAKAITVGAQFSSATTNTLTCLSFYIESLGA